MRDSPSRTAEAVCLFRAMEQRRAKEIQILDDPLAKLFLGPAMRATLKTIEATGRLGEMAEAHAQGLVSFVLARHRFIDDCLIRALAADEVQQVVLLGAGYDTRAYRFREALKDRKVYELDFPATSQRKAKLVEKHGLQGEVVHLEIDFLTDPIDACLSRSTFQRGLPTFFIWEGVSMYLTREAVKATLRLIHELSPQALLALDFWYLLDTPDLRSTASRMSPNFLHFFGEPVTFSMHPEDLGSFLSREQFELVECASNTTLEGRYVKDERRVYPACYVAFARAI